GGGGGILPAAGPSLAVIAALRATLIGLALSVAGVGVLLRYFGQVPGLSRLILADTASTSAPGVPEAAAHVAGDAVLGGGAVAVGQTGTVVSTLRPAGEAEIAGQLVDVTSTGAYLEPGTAVRVVEVTRFTVVVDAVETG
ncbi:MAG: NfeD family protein, partial [Planctomycetota bacterium]